jgi:hypothetical protein
MKIEILKELFKTVHDFMKRRTTWSDCVGLCTATAHLMAGNK